MASLEALNNKGPHHYPKDVVLELPTIIYPKGNVNKSTPTTSRVAVSASEAIETKTNNQPSHKKITAKQLQFPGNTVNYEVALRDGIFEYKPIGVSPFMTINFDTKTKSFCLRLRSSNTAAVKAYFDQNSITGLWSDFSPLIEITLTEENAQNFFLLWKQNTGSISGYDKIFKAFMDTKKPKK